MRKPHQFGRVAWNLGEDGFLNKMTGASAKVYLALGCRNRRALTDNGACWPSVATLARETGLTERSVFACTGRLAELGLLTIKPGGGRGHGRLYELCGNPERRFTLSSHETLNAGSRNPEPVCAETLNTRSREVDKGKKERKAAAPPEPKPFWSAETGWQNTNGRQRESWAKAYPAVDIDNNLARMDAWLRANPRKAHKRNWARFIVNWLSRETDGGDRELLPRPGRGASDMRSDQGNREYTRARIAELTGDTPDGRTNDSG